MVEKRSLEEILKNPERRYGIFKIIHGKVLNDEMIDEIDSCGFAGIVGNIDYQPDFNDNEELWKKTAENMRKYIDRGMHTWIYDEDGYPSGTASGYLTEHYPEFAAQCLYCYQFWKPVIGPTLMRSDIPGTALWRAALLSADGERLIDVTDSLNENKVLYINVPEGEYTLFILTKYSFFDRVLCSDSRNYINLTNKKATEKFLEVTHEHYKKYLSDEFGNGILASFTDEPALLSFIASSRGQYPYLHWQEDFPEKFKERYGYDYLEACIAVLAEHKKDAIKQRCDYWDFIADAVVDGFFKPIQEWCHKNNLKSSGHLFGEEWLYQHVMAYGSLYRSIKHLDLPGLDMLETKPEYLMNEWRIEARFISSFADISGEHEVLTEFSNYTMRTWRNEPTGLDCYYGSANWHLAMGVNNFTSYYSFDGLTNEDIQKLNRYIARCGEILRWGNRDSRTAVFYPEPDMWSAYNISGGECGGEKLNLITENFNKISWELLHRQTDFDYVDGELIKNAKIENGALCYNDRRYTDIIFSVLNVVEDKVAKKIIEMADAGIRVYILDGTGEISRETGEKSPYADKLSELLNSGVVNGNNNGDILKMLGNNFRGNIIKTDKYQTKLLTHCRITEDGTRVIFAANMGYDKLCDNITVCGRYAKLYDIKPEDGTFTEHDLRSAGSETMFHISLDGIKAHIYVLEE